MFSPWDKGRIMLLRRISKHVKDQNWFAVALDFLIVVAGILIAFQITNWSEARVESHREKVLLERMHLDFDRIVTWGEGVMPPVSSAPENTNWLIEQIRADAKPELDERFRQSVAAGVNVYAVFELSPTYQELVSTGTLSRISNPELRESLANYGRSREGERLVTEALFAVQNTGVLRRPIHFQTLGDDTDQTLNDSLQNILTPVSFDWDGLKKTEPHLHVLLVNQLYVRGWKERTLQDAERVLALLKGELGATAEIETEEVESKESQ